MCIRLSKTFLSFIVFKGVKQDRTMPQILFNVHMNRLSVSLDIVLILGDGLGTRYLINYAIQIVVFDIFIIYQYSKTSNHMIKACY